MKDGALITWWLPGLPLLGALASLLLWSNPARLKLSSVVWSIVSLGSIVGFSSQLVIPPEGLLPLYLLPLTAMISMLGQPAHAEHRLSWIMTLIFLGLGLCVVMNQLPVSAVASMLLFSLVALL